jgi:hypothetical protein
MAFLPERAQLFTGDQFAGCNAFSTLQSNVPLSTNAPHGGRVKHQSQQAAKQESDQADLEKKRQSSHREHYKLHKQFKQPEHSGHE